MRCTHVALVRLSSLAVLGIMQLKRLLGTMHTRRVARPPWSSAASAMVGRCPLSLTWVAYSACHHGQDPSACVIRDTAMSVPCFGYSAYTQHSNSGDGLLHVCVCMRACMCVCVWGRRWLCALSYPCASIRRSLCGHRGPHCCSVASVDVPAPNRPRRRYGACYCISARGGPPHICRLYRCTGHRPTCPSNNNSSNNNNGTGHAR